MPAILVQLRVENYEKWRKFFEENAPTRNALGATSTTILQQENDPNSVAILFEVPDLNRAKQFSQSPELREAQQRSGVIGMPNVSYYSDVVHPQFKSYTAER